jgi:hypothetical protein
VVVLWGPIRLNGEYGLQGCAKHVAEMMRGHGVCRCWKRDEIGNSVGLGYNLEE